MGHVDVIIIENNTATRDRLVSAVNLHPSLNVKAALANLAEARNELKNDKPDIALVDLGLPDGDGTDLIRELQSFETECLVVTVFDDERHVIRALEAGASGYLLKDTPLKK